MFKSINDSLYEIIRNLFNEKDKNSIIEPLICLIRLAILDFKPVGTKISIYNNRITYNEPNILQGAVRWSNGDARDDLHNIYLPIRKVGTWYDVSKPEIENIFKFAIRGLEKLKKSYSRNSTINHSLQYYINTLKSFINKTDESNTRRSKRHEEMNVEETPEENTIFNKLKGIWNDREISIINNLLIEMESRRNDSPEAPNNVLERGSSSYQTDSETIILTLETLISSKENKVYDLILRSTTLLE